MNIFKFEAEFEAEAPVEVVHVHPLDNGLVILAQPMPWLRTAAFSLAVPAGVQAEPLDRGGLAGLMCEMVQRGAGPYSSREVVELQDHWGLDHSSGVTSSLASYGASMPADALSEALSLYAEIIRRPHLPEDQLDDALQVSLQELRAVEDEPTQQVMMRLKQLQYGPISGRPACGNLAGIEAITIEDVRQFFADRYRPAGSILAIAGNFDWNAVRDQAVALFGDWEGGPGAEIRLDQGKPGYEHLPQDSSQTHIGFSFDAAPFRDEAFYQLRAGIGVLSDGMSSRLFDRVREQRGLCYTVSASTHSLLDRGAIFGYAGTTPERAQETLDVTLGEVQALPQGIEPAELERWKVRVQSSLIMEQESCTSAVASMLSDWYHRGRVVTAREIEAIIEALTVEQVVEYWRSHPPKDFRIVTLGPQPLIVPAS
ncbi:MAG: M16 family metallopeptidase [Planctomycetaceae bacterium]